MKKSKLARNGVILLVSGATLLFACWLNSHLMFRSLFDPLTASRRSLRHAGLAIVIWSFLAGMATALMSVRC